MAGRRMGLWHWKQRLGLGLASPYHWDSLRQWLWRVGGCLKLGAVRSSALIPRKRKCTGEEWLEGGHNLTDKGQQQ